MIAHAFLRPGSGVSPGSTTAAEDAAERDRHRDRLRAAGVFAWVVAAHLTWLAGDLLWNRPISPLFAGDALHYLEEARHLASGERPGAGLPFHPPLTAWLLTPLWWALGAPERVFVAAKLLMVALNGATWAATYWLLRRRVPLAGVVCLLGPLAFGELLLSSAANSEAPYRLLLAGLLLLGTRWPALGGALHAAAALARAEHLLAMAAGAVAVALARPRLRRWVASTLLATSVLLVPYVLSARSELRDYNRRFAAELAEPLPEWVPVSFYGPLNFALAQREEGIHFSRQTLPPGAAGRAELDPTVPEHLELVVHGYRVGLAEIAARPGRFLVRAGQKLAHSLRALGGGWTWRDLPKSAPWVRQPVDLAAAPAPLWWAVSLALAGLGAWSLRAERALLAAIAALVAYRLAVNAVFFPYLRGMMIAAPAYLTLFWLGWRPLLRGATRRALTAALVALALVHFAEGWRTRRYLLAGERDAAGVILDDRPVIVKFAGFYEAP
jgi:hypothetical protein